MFFTSSNSGNGDTETKVLMPTAKVSEQEEDEFSHWLLGLACGESGTRNCQRGGQQMRRSKDDGPEGAPRRAEVGTGDHVHGCMLLLLLLSESARTTTNCSMVMFRVVWNSSTAIRAFRTSGPTKCPKADRIVANFFL